MAASVNDKNHMKLELAATEGLEKFGFVVDSGEIYHHTEDEREREINALRFADNATARGVRSRPDVICTWENHQEADFTFAADFKSNSGTKPNMVLELEPLFRHVMDYENCGDLMMYIYADFRDRNVFKDKVTGMRGVWCQDVLPLVTEWYINEKTPNKERFYAMAKKLFLNLKEPKPTKYDGIDPFVVVPIEEVRKLRHPRYLVRDSIAASSSLYIVFAEEARPNDDDESDND